MDDISSKVHMHALRTLHRVAAEVMALPALHAALPTGASLMAGYHLVPSLYPIHLHILSDDMDSTHMKHKKHWNSFTTAFFVPPTRVEACWAKTQTQTQVQTHTHTQGWSLGRQLRADVEMQTGLTPAALLQESLACHRCIQPLPNMPALKRHIAHCTSGEEGGGRVYV